MAPTIVLHSMAKHECWHLENATCTTQGQKQAFGGKDAKWSLAPAQEHKYDTLAAFDAGQLQEAQHAFDLSVWSDLKNDRGNMTIQIFSHLLCHMVHAHYSYSCPCTHVPLSCHRLHAYVT